MPLSDFTYSEMINTLKFSNFLTLTFSDIFTLSPSLHLHVAQETVQDILI